MSGWAWAALACAPFAITALIARAGCVLNSRRRNPMARICRHQLRPVDHAPQWLACDTCCADFPHRPDCPGNGTTGCVLVCMTPEDARREIAALEAVYALPDATTGDAR